MLIRTDALAGPPPRPASTTSALPPLQPAHREKLRLLGTLVRSLVWRPPSQGMGGKEVEAFLSMLANERKVAPATHRRALSALLFLYKEVLDLELPWMQEIGRSLPTKHIPVVPSSDEVKQILFLMDGVVGLLARLLYRAGMRLQEGLSLRDVLRIGDPLSRKPTFKLAGSFCVGIRARSRHQV
jgi:hypothetical protein